MAASLVSTAPAAASYSSEIAALKAQQATLLQQLSALQGQAASAGQQAATTEQQIGAVQQQLTQDETELSQVSAQLAHTKDQLATTEAQMARDRTQLADMVTILYQRNGNNSLAAAIANSSSISKLVDDTLALQSVRQQFDSLTQQLIADANTLKSLQTEQVAQVQQVNALVASVQSQEGQLQSQEAAYSAQQSSLSGQAGAIAAQVRQIGSQILLLEEEAAASVGGNGVGSGGNIIAICPPGNPQCYNGSFVNQDAYPMGQCTWFVATQAYVGWLGNADQWISGDANPHPGPTYPIGMTPEVNSMVVFDSGGAYNVPWGHVAWVVAVGPGSQFVVEEDNYLSGRYGGYEDTRIVPSTAGVEGFIYPG